MVEHTHSLTEKPKTNEHKLASQLNCCVYYNFNTVCFGCNKVDYKQGIVINLTYVQNEDIAETGNPA